jgi:hypothetical protein
LLIIEESFHNRIALNINGTIAMQRDDWANNKKK